MSCIFENSMLNTLGKTKLTFLRKGNLLKHVPTLSTCLEMLLLKYKNINPFIPDVLQWTLLSLNSDTFIVANRNIGQNLKLNSKQCRS